MRLKLASMLVFLLVVPVAAQPVESFEAFIANFAGKAIAAGVSRETYQAAMVGLTPDPRVPDLVTTQPEFTTPIWDYIEGRVTAGRIERGKAAMSRNGDLFTATGQRYGVDPYLLGAIWGMETDYGAVLGNKGLIRPIVRSLATLVHQRRSRLVEDEADLIAALQLVQRGPLNAQQLVGSWAGAIGHLQVNPSNVVAHGTDGDGDGRVDLHNSLADALATSAKFLRSLGYQPGVDWGFEVSVPAGFDYLLADRAQMRPISFFAEQGIARVSGRPFADANLGVFLYVPAGKDGPKFLMTQNYLVLKGYNFSDSYALSVAHMTDRLKGGGAFKDDWPRGTALPNLAQRQAIQQALKQLGFYDGAVDGRIGPISQAAYARFQAARGEVADGFITRASHDVLAAAGR
ncbi:lytic murein transglycosylase [Devosia limi]|uniref:Membrane-bound lytic murein transglycosylase B n=1 Tax=Devosia limi DSM 17137 TaxID=1121477 RepID=A0A1M4TFF2_9HYPH|nr:lytic murein transglycosylase [Devosia limi]SHE43105.1 membrane-bound lytic murein transglycosylase B [Devosia limi DSM 17137]